MFVTLERFATGGYLDHQNVNLLDEVLGWAAISGIFVAIASVIFALPALALARSATTLSLPKLLGLGAVVGPVGAGLIGAPMIAHYGRLAEFALLGAFCGLVGALVWWLLYERSRPKLALDA